MEKSLLLSYLCVAGGFLTEMSIGSMTYTFGNILPYIASYLASKHENTEQNYQFYIDQTTWIVTVRMVCFVIGNFIAHKFVQWFDARIGILIGDIIITASVALTYFTVSSFTGLLLTYGIISGIGLGISYVIPLSIVIKWFPDSQAFVSGIILAGYALAPLPFNIIITYLINPNNVKLDPHSGFLNKDSVLENVPSSFWKLAIISFAMQLLGLLLMKVAGDVNDNNADIAILYKEQIEFNEMEKHDRDIMKRNVKTKTNENEKSQLLNTENTNNSSFSDIDKYDFLKQAKFWNIWATTFFSQMTLIFYSTHWKSFSNQQLNIDNDVLLSYMGSFSSIASALGRIFWGYIRVKTSYINTLTIMTLCDCVLFVTWPYLNGIFGDNLRLIVFAFIWYGGICFFQIGLYNIMVQRVSEYWGIDKVNYYYGLLSTNQIPASILSTLVIVWMRGMFGWSTMALIMAACQFASFCFVMSSNRCI